MNETNASTKDIEDLDREAREALDKLADKREELQRQLEETKLAEQRQRERGEELRRQEELEADQLAEEEARARREKITGEADQLEAEREELANRLQEIIERLQFLYWELATELSQSRKQADKDRANDMAVGHGSRQRNWLEKKFGRWLG
jgi:DNA repair exonuclease SbcCD ATPase subunit